jgi:hypothetical protein
MDLDYFKHAVDCSYDSPNFLGLMGGEPLLHPDFERMCEYIQDKKPKEKRALWTTLPDGFEHNADIICETFGHILINDHTGPEIYHAPVLVAAEEVITDRQELFMTLDHCWLQEAWSSVVNPKGGYFCEIAAALALLLDGSDGWPIEPGWWKRTPKDFKEQIEEFCPQCGIGLSLSRRSSNDDVDDISAGMVEKLKGKSRRVDKGKYQVSDLKIIQQPEQMAAYKDPVYRQKVAARYNILLVMNQQGYMSPVKASHPIFIPEKTIFEQIKEKYA